MKRIIYTFVFLGSIYTAIGQEYFSMYSMRNRVLQNNNLSPAFLSNNEFSLGVPALNIGLYTNTNFRVIDFLMKGSDNKWTYDLENLYKISQGNNNIVTDAYINLLSFGFKAGKMQFSFFYNIRVYGALNYSKELAKVLNYGFTESTTLVDNALDFNAYQEISLGVKRAFLEEKLAIGIRAKFLNGWAHYSFVNENISLDSMDEKTGHWTINSSNNYLKMSKPIANNFYNYTGNFGLAGDIGVSFKLDEHIDFDLSVLDIGFIHWREGIDNQTIKNNENHVYKGMDLRESGGLDFQKSLETIYKITKDKTPFSKILPIKGYLSTRYKINKDHSFNAVVFYNTTYVRPSYSIGYNLNHKNIGLGVNGTYDGISKKFKAGGSIVLDMGGFQFYLASDQLLNIGGQIKQTYNANIQFGFNFFLINPSRISKNNLYDAIVNPPKKKRRRRRRRRR